MSLSQKSIRVLYATAVVGVLGAAGGALGGVLIGLAFAVASLVNPASRPHLDFGDVTFIVSIAAQLGAGFGVILGPLFAWTLLRRAPLWRAIGETALAAALGVGVSQVVRWPYAVFVFPVISSALAAVRLRVSLNRKFDAVELPRDGRSTDYNRT